LFGVPQLFIFDDDTSDSHSDLLAELVYYQVKLCVELEDYDDVNFHMNYEYYGGMLPNVNSIRFVRDDRYCGDLKFGPLYEGEVVNLRLRCHPARDCRHVRKVELVHQLEEGEMEPNDKVAVELPKVYDFYVLNLVPESDEFGFFTPQVISN